MPDTNSSLLWNDQMKQVYKALAPLSLGLVGIGAASRAFTGARDGSLAFGDVRDNLKLLAKEDPYIGSINESITLPRKGKQTKAISLTSKLRKELDKEEERNKVSFLNFSNTVSPLSTFFRGSANPTGNETATEIPAFWPLAFLATTGSLATGRALMDSKLKTTASNKLKKEKEKVKREFEAALIYEQEEAAKRNKKAAEQCELVQAVDAFYSAAARYDGLVKTAAGIEKNIYGLAGLLAVLAGAKGFQSSYAKKKEEIEKKETERLLGLNSDYDDTLRNLSAKNLAQLPGAGVSEYRAPSIGTQLLKESAKKKYLG